LEQLHVTAVLRRRILRPDRFAKLSAEQKASGLFFEIGPQTTAKEHVEGPP
jgi:hypothetical protein